MATTKDRSIAAAGALLLQGLLVYAFVNLSLLPSFAPRSAAVLHFITLPLPTDSPLAPPKTPRPAPAAAPKPPALKAQAIPIVVPPPIIPLFVPPPLRPTAAIPGIATAPTQGAAPIPGPANGGGGTGNATSTGGDGDGDGGTPAEWLRGRIRSSDYPPDAAANGMQGGLRTRYTIDVRGRIIACSIAESSGNALLDRRTCDLATSRYRYRPARDAAGRAVIGHDSQRHRWIILGPGESPPPPAFENQR
jgi:protein TonB